MAVFSHGAAIRTWVAWTAANLDEENTRGLFLDNTGIVVLEGDPETGWIAILWEGSAIGGRRLDDPRPSTRPAI